MRQLSVSALRERLLQYKLVQGPLAGVSSVPFRDLIWRFSQPAWVYSEMISCQTILSGSLEIRHRYCQTSATEGPLVMQIAASDADTCARACVVLNQLDISMIDLNVGCPVKKIRKRGQGSKLLSDPERLRAVLQALRDHSRHPISVKIRVDGHSSDAYNAQVLSVVNAVGPDFLVVHGRHYQDGYDVPCHLSQIAFFAQHATMPVIGNGDVCDAASAQAMLATGCVGAMIARASVGAPWLIGQIQQAMQLVTGAQTLDTQQSYAIFCEHMAGLSHMLGSERHALNHARGLIKYYAKRNHYSKALIARVHMADCLADLNYADIAI